MVHYTKPNKIKIKQSDEVNESTNAHGKSWKNHLSNSLEHGKECCSSWKLPQCESRGNGNLSYCRKIIITNPSSFYTCMQLKLQKQLNIEILVSFHICKFCLVLKECWFNQWKLPFWERNRTIESFLVEKINMNSQWWFYYQILWEFFTNSTMAPK